MNGNVTITTTSPGSGDGDINFDAPLDINGIGVRTLTLNATRNINIDQPISDSVPGGGDNLTIQAITGTATNFGASMALGNGIFTATGGGSGVVTFDTAAAVTLSNMAQFNAGTLNVSNGTNTFDSPVNVATRFNMSGGTLTGSAAVTVSGTGNTWTGGTMIGTGSTVFTAGNTLAISGAATKTFRQRTLTTGGVTTWSGGAIQGMDGGTFNNNGTFDVQTDLTWFSQFGGAPTILNNAGTITRTVGTGTAGLDAVIVNGAGPINVNTGTLRLSDSAGAAVGALTGAMTIANGATLDFGGGVYNLTGGATIGGAGGNLTVSGSTLTTTVPVTASGVLTVSSGTANFNAHGTLLGPSSVTVSNSGTANFNRGLNSGGNLNISGGTASFNAAATFQGILNLSGGALSGTSALTINDDASSGSQWTGGAMTGTGSTVIGSGSPLTISGATTKIFRQRTLTTGGVTTWSGGGIQGQDGGTFNNNGTFDVQTDLTWFSQFGGAPTILNNAGTITRTVGTGTAGLDAVIVNGAGPINVNTGTLRLSDSAGVAVGALTGAMTIANGATLDFGGGIYNLTGGATIGGPGGNLTVSGSTLTTTVPVTATGALTVSSGTANFNANATPLTPSSVTVSGNGTANFNRTLTDAGALTIPSGTANFNVDSTVAGALTLSGGTLAGSNMLTVNGNGSVWSDGAMLGTGSTVLSGTNTLAISGAATKVFRQRTLTTGGVTTWSGGAIQGQDGGTFNNNGTFDVQTDLTWFSQFGGAPTT